MKRVMKIFIPVASLHLLLGILFLQQGCTNLNNGLRPEEARIVAQQSYSEPVRIEEIKFEEKVPLSTVETGLGDKADNAMVMSRRIRQEPRRPTILAKNEIAFEETNEAKGDYTEYRVIKGDSLWLIAKKHETTVTAIAEASGINHGDILKVGQTLKIPANHDPIYNLNNPALDIFKEEGADYIIQKGDSLSVIARRFGVGLEELKATNDLQGSTIYAGKKIIIPGVNKEKVAAVMASMERDIQKEAFQTIAAKQNIPVTGTHKVESGETLSEIAKSYGVSVNELMALNNMADARKLRAGQQLIIRAQNEMEIAPVVIESSIALEPGEAVAQPMIAHSEVLSADGTMQLTPQLQNDALLNEETLFDLTEEAPVVHLTSVTSDLEQ